MNQKLLDSTCVGLRGVEIDIATHNGTSAGFLQQLSHHKHGSGEVHRLILSPQLFTRPPLRSKLKQRRSYRSPRVPWWKSRP